MDVDERYRRRLFQKVKGMTQEQFDRMMRNLYDAHYGIAVKQFTEAMGIELTPKQRAAVLAKWEEIRDTWPNEGLL